MVKYLSCKGQSVLNDICVSQDVVLEKDKKYNLTVEVVFIILCDFSEKK